jgi:CheY-like chemotaxis protein
MFQYSCEVVCGAVAVSLGGRSVARILVADDNSNIQKMVGLALKDQGIDVIAVGNGEAAVRKISDVRPDLVLADVFMPVRNGYEVCKYVKDDSSLAHIPVILLVGAFDPLDEQEAQRVGADGVLKKPFVPPDPLISMVKSALMRAANTASAAKAVAVIEKAAVPSLAVAGGPTTAGGPNATVVSAPAVYAIPKEEQPIESQSFVDEIPNKPETLNIESAGKPLAFGSLMETVTEGTDDAAFVAPPNPELADRDWNAGEEEADEEEEEDSASSTWRRDGGSEELAADPAIENAAEKAAARNKRRESWTPTREKTQDLLEEAAAPESFISAPPPAPVFSEVAPPQNSYPIAQSPRPELVESKTVVETKTASNPEVASPVIATIPEPAAPESTKPNGANSWFSTTTSPWEAEAQKANQLAATWDAPAVPAAIAPNEQNDEPVLEQLPVVEEIQPEAALTYDFVSEAPSEEPVSYVPDPGLVGNEIVDHTPLPELISDGSISVETVESIRQETSYALESVTESAATKPANNATAKFVETSQQDMDALVANVLAKMSPEMLQAVTREILKPVVAAMIRDEINAKKS